MLPTPQFPSKKFTEDFIRPLRYYFAPKLIGLDTLDITRPALYVSNHTLFGLTDGIFLGVEMYLQRDVQLRTLVDELHMDMPFWRDMVQKIGFVKGSRENCTALMEAQEHILVFPGGRREIFKNKGEAYKLRWENRYGFVRMAIQHGYDIIPVAGVGGEETYQILVDGKDILQSPLGLALKATGVADKYLKGGEYLIPITKGLGWTGLPKPERLFIQLGERIPTAHLRGDAEDETVLADVKGQVETAFEGLFDELHRVRKETRDEPWRWMLKRW